MSIKQLDRLLFVQGGRCFFCAEPLARSDASIEHLVASSRGGSNGLDNCVACCQAVNALFADLPVKAKLEIVLRTGFTCPRALLQQPRPTQAPEAPRGISAELVLAAVEDLERRGASRPKSLQALHKTLHSALAKQLNGVSTQALVDRLREERYVLCESDDKVSYPLLKLQA